MQAGAPGRPCKRTPMHAPPASTRSAPASPSAPSQPGAAPHLPPPCVIKVVVQRIQRGRQVAVRQGAGVRRQQHLWLCRRRHLGAAQARLQLRAGRGARLRCSRGKATCLSTPQRPPVGCLFCCWSRDGRAGGRRGQVALDRLSCPAAAFTVLNTGQQWPGIARRCPAPRTSSAVRRMRALSDRSSSTCVLSVAPCALCPSAAAPPCVPSAL